MLIIHLVPDHIFRPEGLKSCLHYIKGFQVIIAPPPKKNSRIKISLVIFVVRDVCSSFVALLAAVAAIRGRIPIS